MKDHGIPVVFFDRVPDLPDAYTVSCNLKNSSVKLVDWLVEKGFTRIGFIKGPDSLLPSRERLEGYYEALKKHDLKMEPTYVVETDLGKKKTEEAIRQLLALPNPPKAVIAFNDYVALDAIRFARSQGLRINQDIFFVSYANLPVTSYLDEPPIASVEQFPYLQAEKATDILFQLIDAKEGRENIEKKLVLDSKVIVNKEV
jgi:LacI family transcriptional regulator